jgi:hypothetical protein
MRRAKRESFLMRFTSRSRERHRFGLVHRTFSLRWAGSLLLLATSLVVVASVVEFATASPSEQAFASVDQVTITSTKNEVVYGKITRSKRPLPGAIVQIFNSKVRLVRSGQTNALGLYRLVLRVPAGKYTMVLHKGRGAAFNVRATVRHRLKPGLHLRVSARIVAGTRFFVLPFFTY